MHSVVLDFWDNVCNPCFIACDDPVQKLVAAPSSWYRCWLYALCLLFWSQLLFSVHSNFITDRTSQSAVAGIRASIFNHYNDATVRTREVPLVHASCDVHYTIMYTQSLHAIYALLAAGRVGKPRPGSMDFFQSVKILTMTSFGREVKPWVPCRRFTARKRTSSRNYSLWAKFVGLFTLYVGSDADDLNC